MGLGWTATAHGSGVCCAALSLPGLPWSCPVPPADPHFHFGAQALSNIIYSAASVGHRAGDGLLHAVGRAAAWEIGEFKPQASGRRSCCC